jgi:tetratricopeptide (TPR) repeat protein
MLKSLMKLGIGMGLMLGTATAATAQCNTWEAYPKGVQVAKEQHVIYRDNVRSKQYKEAYPIWKDLYQHVQVVMVREQKSPLHFQDGIQIYKSFAENEKDAAKKKEHIAAMMKLYDDMAACMGEKSDDKAYQGYYLWYLQGDSREVVKLFEKSMELGGNKTHNMVLAPMAQLTVYLFNAYKGAEDQKFNPEYMRKLYEKLKGLSEHNIKNNKKFGPQYDAAWKTVQTEFDKIGPKIWGCEFHEGKVRPEFEKDKENMAQNAEFLKLLKKKCGKENALYLEINAIYQPWRDSMDFEILKKQFDSMCNLKRGKLREKEARKAEKAGDAEKAEALRNEATEWYEKSLDDAITEECETTTDKKGELAYSIAYKYFKKGNYSKAKSLCYKAAELKKGWGEPYMLIGNMYASSGKRCSGGKGTGWDAQVVAWAATDMWNKAKSVDASVAASANSKIAKYRKYYPTQGDIFQRGLKVGGSYKISCLGVTTTIRAAVE